MPHSGSEAPRYFKGRANKKAVKSYKMAEAAFKRNNLENAIVNLNKAIKKDKDFIEAWLLLGDIYTELNRNQDAIKSFQKSLQIDSAFFPRCYFFIGNLAFDEGDYQMSAQYLARYLKFDNEQEITKGIAKNRLKRAQVAYDLITHPLDVQPVNCGDRLNTDEDEYVNFVDEDYGEMILTRKEKTEIDGEGRQLIREIFLHSDNSVILV